MLKKRLTDFVLVAVLAIYAVVIIGGVVINNPNNGENRSGRA